MTNNTASYIASIIARGEIPEIHACDDCDASFEIASDAIETHHGVLMIDESRFTLAIGCEGYHQL